VIRFHQAVQSLLVDVDTLRPDTRNANNGDIDAIMQSVQVNGCYRPIYAADDGTIVAGHHLYAALIQLGATQVPVQTVEGDFETRTRILLGDNEIARLAWTDEALLLDLLNSLTETDLRYEGTGFTEERVDLLRLAQVEGGGFAVPEAGTDPLPHQCPNCGHTWFGSCAGETRD
jgi:ParB-like chromosome segregation protein Spo0J